MVGMAPFNVRQNGLEKQPAVEEKLSEKASDGAVSKHYADMLRTSMK